MKRQHVSLAILIAFISIIYSCNSASENKPDNAYETKTDTAAVNTIPLRDKVLTAEEQKALTPDAVIQSLKDGNKSFVDNNITARDHSAMVIQAVAGQYPKAVILSCLDSRIPVEDVFNKGIGDLFVARVAGNFANEDILGSLEFGCKVSGAKVIVVLGHESCGAIKGAIDNVKLGNITAMLSKIKPAVIKSQDFNGDKTSKNAAYVEYVAKNNIINTIATIRSKSAVLKEMEDKGEIKIVGAYYDLKTGEVIFL
jgi:carbonic anhydrase